MLSTTAHHAVLNTSRSQRYGISLTYMAHVGVVVVVVVVVVGTLSGDVRGQNGFPQRRFLPASWSLGRYRQHKFCRRCGSQALQPSTGAWRTSGRHVRSVTRLYLRFAFMCACLWTRLHGGTALAGRATIPYSYGFFITLYRDIRDMYLLPVYSCYDTYKRVKAVVAGLSLPYKIGCHILGGRV